MTPLFYLIFFNATVTYITHVTELDRFFKTPLYLVNGGGTPPPPILVNAEHCKYIMRRFEASKRRIMYSKCSASKQNGGIVVKWTKF